MAAPFRRVARRALSSTAGAGEAGEGAARRRVLAAALAHVNRRGWSKEALAAGAVDAGLPPAAHGLFPRGAAELAEHWMGAGNERLREFLEGEAGKRREGLPALRGAELVVAALCRRLEHTVPYLRSWPQAMALGLYPGNLPTTLQRLDAIPELICSAAGEAEPGRAAEWRQRKALVGAVFASAELYMLTDYSEGYRDTRAFVAARLRDALLLQERIPLDTLAAALSGAGSLVSAAATMLAPLLPAVPPTLPGGAAQGVPSPQEFVGRAAAVAEHARAAAVDIVSSSNPAKTALEYLQHAAAARPGHPSPPQQPQPQPQQQQQQQQQQPQQPPLSPPQQQPRVPAAAARAPPGAALDPFHVGEVDEDASLDPVRLPSGMSLFGLMSMPVREVEAIVRASNPAFIIVVTKASEEAEPRAERNLVRLMVDDAGIVVDVLRS